MGARLNRGGSRQDYQTPPELLEAVKKRLGIDGFTLDLAASKETSVGHWYYDEEMDSLSDRCPWTTEGWHWLNPPYANITPWVRKAYLEAEKGAQVVVLVPASVGANWWKNWVEPAAYVSFLNGRITFVGQPTPYPKDCAILLYTPWGFRGSEIWTWKE